MSFHSTEQEPTRPRRTNWRWLVTSLSLVTLSILSLGLNGPILIGVLAFVLLISAALCYVVICMTPGPALVRGLVGVMATLLFWLVLADMMDSSVPRPKTETTFPHVLPPL